MPDEPQQISITDPDRVHETFCDGPFNILAMGSFAHLTFTTMRRKTEPLFRDGTIEHEGTVRARIVITTENLVALRDLLNRIRQYPTTPQPPAGGTRH